MSVNWNWPGDISATAPSEGQLLKGSVKFVVPKALKLVPAVAEKPN
jgi:hypothetical protein